MRFRCPTPTFVVCLAISLNAAVLAQESAALSGQVVDPTKALIVGAELTLTDLGRGVARSTKTDETGRYIFDPLPSGDYSLVVRSKGFADLHIERIVLKVRDREMLKLEMALGVATSSVTVRADAQGVQADASAGAVVEEDYLRHLPVNGRSITGLLQMAPGITTGTGPAGEINSNGLRSNTNYYSLDGLSLGGGMPVGGGAGVGGGTPRMGGGGTSGGMGGPLDSVSLDSVQEVRIQTSAFAPEFGRTPGAQISMTSRGGTNGFHGSLYEYFRNDHFNANDWFANEAGLDRGRMLQNQFGGTLGGPIVKNRTFFFASGDVAWLRTPTTSVASVPDLQSRAAAPAELRVYMRAFPKPNGPELDEGAARFASVTTNPQNRETYALRVDHAVNDRNTLFARYSYTPYDGTSRGSDFVSPNVVSSSHITSQMVTGGWTKVISPAATNDLRVNVSKTSLTSSGYMDTLGGAVPLTDGQVFPSGVDSANGSFSMSVLGLTSYMMGQRGGSEQRQINIVDGFSATAGAHTYKMGVDYRTVAATNHDVPYTSMATFSGMAAGDGSLLSGEATMASISSNLTEVYPYSVNWSAYIQDTYRPTASFTITFGMRWDVNPAPRVWQGERPFAISSFDSTRVTQGEPLYNTRWSDLAPRVGVVKQAGTRKGYETVYRGGFGIFHDPGYGTSLSAFSGAPYASINTLTLPDFPLSTGDKEPPGLPATKPFGRLGAAERSLKSPLVWQWNFTIERGFGVNQTLSVGYAGTHGSRLLRTEMQPSYSGDYDILSLATNGADSSYHALQVQFRRRATRNLQMQLSYTWSHSIDTASTDFGMGGFATLFTSEKGNSDYDVRQNLNASGSWKLPAPEGNWLSPVLGNWWSDFMFTWRTGTPFDVVGVSESASSSSASGRGIFAQVRPDYNGLPVWVDDPTVPGGRRLNRDAFDSPSGYAQGNLGRNAISGFGITQLNLSLRRQINVRERQALHLSVEAFNLLNHPSFANPSRNEGASMTSANFGVSTRAQGQGFGGTGSLYQTGGPRSLQFVVRYQF